MPTPKDKKCDTLNLEEGKVLRNGQKVMTCPKFPIGRTLSGYWKSHITEVGQIQDFSQEGVHHLKELPFLWCLTSILQPHLMFYFNTNKPQSCCFLLNTSSIRKLQVISGGGGAHLLHTPPRSPLYHDFKAVAVNIMINFTG